MKNKKPTTCDKRTIWTQTTRITIRSWIMAIYQIKEPNQECRIKYSIPSNLGSRWTLTLRIEHFLGIIIHNNRISEWWDSNRTSHIRVEILMKGIYWTITKVNLTLRIKLLMLKCGLGKEKTVLTCKEMNLYFLKV